MPGRSAGHAGTGPGWGLHPRPAAGARPGRTGAGRPACPRTGVTAGCGVGRTAHPARWRCTPPRCARCAGRSSSS
ncbi:hypothetical protein G6F46_014683 [Rhizopus delemar]|nr:hypothetical protein G6F46_014683 [Rhizopus delemar]